MAEDTITETADYDSLTKEELLEEARSRDLSGLSGSTKAELVAALEAYDGEMDANDGGVEEGDEDVDLGPAKPGEPVADPDAPTPPTIKERRERELAAAELDAEARKLESEHDWRLEEAHALHEQEEKPPVGFPDGIIRDGVSAEIMVPPQVKAGEDAGQGTAEEGEPNPATNL